MICIGMRKDLGWGSYYLKLEESMFMPFGRKLPKLNMNPPVCVCIPSTDGPPALWLLVRIPACTLPCVSKDLTMFHPLPDHCGGRRAVMI